MAELQINMLRDQLRATQLRLDQLERDVPRGYALPFTPVIAMTGAVQSANNSGWWVRSNDLLIFWFFIEVSATPGTGSIVVRTPPAANGTPIALGTLGTTTGPSGGRANVGQWHAERVAASNEYVAGWLENTPATPDLVRLRSTGFQAAQAFAIQAGDRIWGRVEERVSRLCEDGGMSRSVPAPQDLDGEVLVEELNAAGVMVGPTDFRMDEAGMLHFDTVDESDMSTISEVALRHVGRGPDAPPPLTVEERLVLLEARVAVLETAAAPVLAPGPDTPERRG